MGRNYKTSNSEYGWKPAEDQLVLTEKVLNGNQTEPAKKLLYKTTSNEYGEEMKQESESLLSQSLDTLLKSKQLKPFQVARKLGYSTGVKNLEENHVSKGYVMSFDKYECNRKKENILMTTTSNEIGAYKPMVGNKVFPLSNKFSNTFTIKFSGKAMN